MKTLRYFPIGRKLLVLSLALVLCLNVGAQRREVHILSVNDMHATLEAMPQLAAIADSLRTLYPSLLVLSAGDNRTGNPLSDMYEPSSFPMVALMNQIGFDASTLGNHDFDMQSLPKLIGLSNFRYLCANVFAEPESGIQTIPYQVFDVEGLKVGVIGAIQTGKNGAPATHPENLRGISFRPIQDVLDQYEWLRGQCEAMVLLSHLGYEDDKQIAQKFPWFDLIIGGHTHTQLNADEPLHNGVLLTQNRNKLRTVTHITLTVDNGQVVNKKAEYIPVRTFKSRNLLIEAMVHHFSDNPSFRRVVARLAAPFENMEEIGCMICDAYVSEGHADIGIQNPGGVRLESMPEGDITVLDVLKMDPFCNMGVEIDLTGKEVLDMLNAYCQEIRNRVPYVSGILCEITPEDDNDQIVKRIRLLTLDGKPLDMKKTYRVVTNSYVSATTSSIRPEQVHMMNTGTADMIMHFLEKRRIVNYHGVRCHIVR